MSKLAFNHVGAESHFVECGGGHCSEAVNCRASVVAHTVERIQHRVVGHVAFARGDGNNKGLFSESGKARSSRKTATAWGASGTMCSRFIFVRSAGMRHNGSFPSRF